MVRKERQSGAFKKLFFFVVVIIILGGILYLGIHLYKKGLEKKYNAARALYEAGEMEQAQTLFSKLKDTRRLNKYRREALYYSSLIQSTRAPKEARELWEEFYLLPDTSNLQKAEALFHLAKIDYDLGSIEEAQQKFQQIIDEYPDSGTPYAGSLIYLGQIHAKGGMTQYLDARGYYEQASAATDSPEIQNQARRLISEVNIALFFSPIQTPESMIYAVEPGDTLSGIANKFNTTIEVIKECNHLTSNFIKPNDRLKVPTVTLSVKISKSLNTLTLYADGKFFALYDVGTGKYNKTPVGEFVIINKIAEPVWYKPEGGIIPYGDPDNLLGTHWMGINFPGYGIHGTWDEDSIGTQSSAGCVRLLNKDIEQLFKMLPISTEVEITD